MPELLNLLTNSRDIKRRVAAASTLGPLRSLDAVDPLIWILGIYEVAVELREQAAESLGYVSNPKARVAMGGPPVSGHVDLLNYMRNLQGDKVGPQNPTDVKIGCAIDMTKKTAWELTPLNLPGDILDSIYSGSLRPIGNSDRMELGKEAAEAAAGSSGARAVVASVSKALGSRISARAAGNMLGMMGKGLGYGASGLTIYNGFQDYRECAH